MALKDEEDKQQPQQIEASASSSQHVLTHLTEMALEDEEDNDESETMQSSSQSILTHLMEIIVNILSRLPVNSLLRCKSVCKSWRSLISDTHFVKSQLLTSNNYPRLIFTTGRNSTVLKTCGLYDVVYDNSINNALKLDSPFKSFYILGSCNGLLCIHREDYTLHICNPSTKKSIKLPYSKHQQIACFVHYGFGYDESTDDYKIVQMYFEPEERYKYETLVMIYSLRDGNWKNIGVFPHGIPLGDCGKFLNGALHWAADDAPSNPNELNLSCEWNIISFDLATETYLEVSQPVYDEGHTDLTLGTLGEWLCVLCEYRRNSVDLWVMKVYGAKDSWTKLVSIPYLTLPRGNRFSVPLCISNDGKFLLLFGSKFIVYDSKDTSFSKVQNNCKCIQVSTFVESLVSPMPAVGLGDR